MNDLDFLGPLIQALGPAAATFGVMYLWIKHLMEQVNEMREERATQEREWLDRLKGWQERADRLHETRAAEQATTIAVLSQIKDAFRAMQGYPHSTQSPQNPYPPSISPPYQTNPHGHPPTFGDDPNVSGDLPPI